MNDHERDVLMVDNSESFGENFQEAPRGMAQDFTYRHVGWSARVGLASHNLSKLHTSQVDVNLRSTSKLDDLNVAVVRA